MDYLNTYNYFQNKVTSQLTKFISTYFKKQFPKNRPYDMVYNKINEHLFSFWKEKYESVLMLHHKECLEMFNKRHALYSGEESSIVQFVLEEEVKEAFQPSEIITSYNSLIAWLSIYANLDLFRNHFQNLKDYNLLVYETQKHDFLRVVPFEGYFKNSKEYKRMLDILDPEGAPKRKKEEKKVNDILKGKIKQSHGVQSMDPGSESLQNEIDCRAKLNLFTDDERYLMTHILYKLIEKEINVPPQGKKRKFNIQLTDFMRIIKIMGEVEDMAIFYKPTKNVTSYKKVNDGLDYYTRRITKQEILESIVSKLKPFKVDSFIDEINRYRYRLRS